MTTAPAATTEPRPSVTPPRIIARIPIQTWSSITTGRSSTLNFGSKALCAAVEMTTSGEMLTLSPILTPPRTSIEQSRLMREFAPMLTPSRRTCPGP